jgi:methylmalonyl-CoA mutase
VFGGGGGVIVPEEIKELDAYGVTKIYSPEDGTRMGLQGIINHMVETMDTATPMWGPGPQMPAPDNKLITVAKLIPGPSSRPPGKTVHLALQPRLAEKKDRKIPVIGITGTGGAGKSSLTDELILRMLHDLKDIRSPSSAPIPPVAKPAAPCWATGFA